MPQPDTDTGDSDREQPRNEEQKGLATDTTVAHIYCACRHKTDWKAEARQNGYTSLSNYLYDLILEARSYRRAGFAVSAPVDRLDELEAEVDALEQKLQRERQEHSGDRASVDDPDFLKQFLTTEYQSLADLMQRVVESGALDNLVRQRVEDQLYYLAAQDRVQYEPGHGWKLTDPNSEA
jgi:hypothetical protein